MTDPDWGNPGRGEGEAVLSEAARGIARALAGGPARTPDSRDLRVSRRGDGPWRVSPRRFGTPTDAIHGFGGAA